MARYSAGAWSSHGLQSLRVMETLGPIGEVLYHEVNELYGSGLLCHICKPVSTFAPLLFNILCPFSSRELLNSRSFRPHKLGASLD